MIARRLVIAAALLGASACFQTKVEPKPQLEVVAALELRVDVPGMAPEDIERSIVAPIELALVGNSDIRTIVSQAREGQARIQLSLSNRAELVAVDVLQRVTAIEAQLPEDAEPPVLRLRDLKPITLHFSWEDENSEAAQALLRALEATPGVREVSRCGPVRTVSVVLDPEAMQRVGVTLIEVERAARSALAMQELTAEGLLQVELRRVEGSTITLADVAAVEVSLIASECMAYTQERQTTGVTVTVAHAQAQASVNEQLDAARERGVVTQRFDSRLDVWLPPGTDPEPLVDRIRADAGAGAGWMLEVGVEAQPCAGPGMLARLHGTGPVDSWADSLAAIPGVTLVERPDHPRLRRWLLGPDIEVLERLGGEAVASAGSTVLLGGERMHEQSFVLDRERLAEHGLDVDAVALAMSIALDGLEIGHLRDVGPVVLKRGPVSEDALADLPIAITDGQPIPLSKVAELRSDEARSRICRRDGERAVVLLMRPEQTPLPFAIELPAGYSWKDG